MTNELIYTGWKKWTPTLDEWAKFSTEPYAPFEMKENEYLLLIDNQDGKARLASQWCYEEGKLRKFGRGSINFKSKKSSEKNICIRPRNDEQVCAIELMQNPRKTVKLLTGT